WITGRLASAPLAATVSAILSDYDFPAYDASRLTGILAGFVIDRVLSAREALDPLQLVFFIDARESEGRIVFAQRGSEFSAAELWLFEAWAARERASFALPPSRLALEPGDAVSLVVDGRTRLLRITEIGEHGDRDIDGRGLDPDIYSGAAPVRRPSPGGPIVI